MLRGFGLSLCMMIYHYYIIYNYILYVYIVYIYSYNDIHIITIYIYVHSLWSVYHQSTNKPHSLDVRSYLLASFHGDTAGALTLPLLRALFSCAAKRFPRLGRRGWNVWSCSCFLCELKNIPPFYLDVCRHFLSNRSTKQIHSLIDCEKNQDLGYLRIM